MVSDWIKGELNGLIEDTLNGWIEEFMNFILSLVNELVFNIPENDFANDVINILTWLTSLAAVVVVVYKIIEYIINTSTGTQQYPLDEIFVRVGKSAGALLVLPWFLRWMIFDVAFPLSNYFAAAGTDFDGQAGFTLLKAALTGFYTGMGGIVLVLFLIFFLVVFIMFLYSVCVFYADILLMQVFIAPVALSMIADDNNFMQVWWRELLSQVLSLLTKLFLMTLIINTLFTGEGNMMLAIGAGALIIKSPSILKHMWYGGGGARATTRGIGSGGSMATRVMIQKLMK
ncbi:conjugal transfer protein TrbL family protein [Halolactibacillus sp. JCM 19043]|uniref:conjugal transfer protein TrbL family protein n=1 Tax=Halolactibacillus sp. JCM 19043 TaxID=1460638 RepID=UPI000780D1DB|nr:conjugal transfer protein TrbL family protein [Halolactibacillus sp. JCM 19043]